MNDSAVNFKPCADKSEVCVVSVLFSPLDDSGDVLVLAGVGLPFLRARLPLGACLTLSFRLRRLQDFELFEAPAATGSWLFLTSGSSTVLPLF